MNTGAPPSYANGMTKIDTYKNFRQNNENCFKIELFRAFHLYFQIQSLTNVQPKFEHYPVHTCQLVTLEPHSEPRCSRCDWSIVKKFDQRTILDLPNDAHEKFRRDWPINTQRRHRRLLEKLC